MSFLIIFFGSLAVLYQIPQLMTIFFDIKVSRKKALAVTACMSVIYAVSAFFYVDNIVGFFMGMALAVGTVFVCFHKESVLRRTIMFLVAYANIFFFDVIMQYNPLLTYLTDKSFAYHKISLDTFFHIDWVEFKNLLVVWVSWTLYILILKLAKKYLVPKVKILIEYHLNLVFLIFVLIYLAIDFILITVSLMNLGMISLYHVILTPIILSVACSMFLFYLVYSRNKKDRKTLKEIGEYQKNIEQLYENTRIFRHDFKNAMHAIKGYSDANQFDELKEYLNSYLQDADFVQSVYVESIASIEDGGLKNLMIAKLLLAQENNVHVSISLNGTPHPNKIIMQVFIEMLGLLLDNAIQSAQESKDRMVYITMNSDEVEIKNTFGTAPDMNKIFEKNYTRKKQHSGIGLYRFAILARKNPQIEYKVALDEDFFIFDIKLKTEGL